MQLRPQDLGPTWHMAVVRQRAMGAARVVIHPRIGTLGRLWSRGLGLTDRVAAHTLPMAADKTGPLVGGLTTGLGFAGLLLLYGGMVGAPLEAALLNGAATLCATAAAMYSSAVLLPRRVFWRLHAQPLRAEELMDLKGVETRPKAQNLPEIPALKLVQKFMHNLRGAAPRRAGDGLEQAFLDLALAVLRQENLSETAQYDLRRTLAELGEAVSALPPAEPGTIEIGDLLAEAEIQAGRARRETDAILAASHLRHADALVARAKAVEQTERRYRQTRGLRDEMVAQIAAVQTALPVFGQSSGQRAMSGSSEFELEMVASRVQSIAREAEAITAAEQELNAAVGNAESSASLNARRAEEAPIRVQQGRS